MSDPLLNAGFTRQQIADALEFCDNDRERVSRVPHLVSACVPPDESVHICRAGARLAEEAEEGRRENPVERVSHHYCYCCSYWGTWFGYMCPEV